MKTPPPVNNPGALRQAAEARLKTRPATASFQTEADLRRLQHELEVHQIELEMQNEELRATNAEIEAERERYTDLYDFAPTGYFTLTADGTIRLVNLTGAKMVGIERAHLLGSWFGMLVADEDRKPFGDFLPRLFAGAPDTECELRPAGAGRIIQRVHLKAMVAPDGERCRVAMLDITARWLAEAALAESNAFMESLFKTIPVGIGIVDETGDILFQNERLKRAANKSQPAKKCWQIYCDDQQQCAECPLKPPIQIGETKAIEKTGVLGGKTYEITHTGMVYQGKPAVLEIFHDVTERKMLEVEFRQSQKMEVIGQLAWGVAHDLNNILAAQFLEIELLPLAEPLSPGVQASLKQIHADADRAANLVRQLLLFSRRQMMRPHDLDLSINTINFSKMLQRLIGEHIELELHTHPSRFGFTPIPA